MKRIQENYENLLTHILINGRMKILKRVKNKKTKDEGDKKMKKGKKAFNKGITLIALVITIIVLLILAGVSIASLTGEGGILNKATKAKNENNLGTIKEEIKLAYHAVQTDSIIHGWNINKKAEELQKELREQGELYFESRLPVLKVVKNGI